MLSRWPERLVLCGLIAAAAQSNADSLGVSNDLSLMASYIVPDGERTDEYGEALRITYGKRLGEYWWLEPTFFSSVFETGRTGFTDYYQQGAGVDFTYRLPGKRALIPFGLAGLGVSRNDVANNPESEVGGYANLGLGLMTSPISDSGLKLRAEIRYLHDSFDEGLSDLHFSAGITLPIGATRKEVVKTVEYVEKPVVVEKERLVAVADTDRDGVADGIDQCPNTLEGLKVNSVGCVVADESQRVVLLGVSFEFNSDRLTANAKDILDETVQALQGQPDLSVELSGHTDNLGSADYNQQLSQQRAEAVRTYLIEQGIDPQRLVARGYGEARPIRSNRTEVGRERNRRVEFDVISD